MADPVTKAVVVAAAGAVGVGVFPEILGVPVTVVIAAFAGAAGILSFLQAMPIARMAGTVFFCSAGGIFGARVLTDLAPVLKGAEPFAALILAAGLQIAVPLLIEHRTRLVEWAASWLPRRGGGGGP